MRAFPFRELETTSARTRRSTSAALAGALLVVLGIHDARASETQWWIVDGAADHAKSESHGIMIQPDGVLEIGPRVVSTPAESLNTVWSIAPLKDGSIALAGDRGRIERWTESGGIKSWVRLPVGQVLCLAPDGAGVIAGTGPEGLIYRIGARGDTTLLARTGERYVWGLARGAAGSWYAATGTHGKLFRIENGHPKVVLDSDESNLISLIEDGAGGAYTGGDSKGRVIHVTAKGVARTLFDAPEDEIRALARGADGALYAAALSASAVSEESSEEGEKPAPVKSAVSGGRAVVYRINPDSAVTAYWTSPQPFVYALGSTPKGVVAATGNRAGVYLIDHLNAGVQWLAAPQGQVTALWVEPDGRVRAATSNPAVLWRIGPERSDRGELMSPVLDARRIARFGRIRWRGDARGAKVELATRSGNTETADTTWSEWKNAGGGAEGSRIGSPSARYLQWKLSLAGGQPRIESVETAWREQNLPPRVEDLVIAPQGQGFREGDLLPRSEPVTQTLPGGQKVEYSIPSPQSPQGLRGLPAWARGLRTAQWHGTDPNGDPLRYQIEVRLESGNAWIVLDDDLDAPTYSWDTNALPDGRYRLRVVATDAPGNPLGEERTAEAMSEPFTVDNSPPSVTDFDAKGDRGEIHLEARAEDGMSPLSRVEVSVDDGDWRTVSPEGGMADDLRLSIHTKLDGIKPGSHTVSLRAVDQAGNAATRAVHVTVPERR